MCRTGRLMKLCAGAALLVAFCCFLMAGSIIAKAEDDAYKVTVGDIDYDKLTMKVFKNGNSILYFSSDGRKTWQEIEGDSGSDDASGAYIEMDISWVSSKADTSVYFKGDKGEAALEVTFPGMNNDFKVTFNKATLDFTFDGYDAATEFMWRKDSDYHWYTVPIDSSTPKHKEFLNTINDLRFKGCKLVFICGQVIGESAENPGQRMSKEVKITIPKMANAPSVKVNVKKFTLNTKSTLEYYDETSWVSCTKNMLISDIAPQVMYSGGSEGKSVALKIRIKATEKAPYSKTTIINIPGQTQAPAFGDAVKTSFDTSGKKKQLILSFPKASAAAPIDYCVVKAGDTFDAATAKWKTIKAANKQVKLTEKNAPNGSMIYIRYTGIAGNDKKNIALKLPSYYAGYAVTWPAETGKDDTKKDGGKS